MSGKKLLQIIPLVGVVAKSAGEGLAEDAVDLPPFYIPDEGLKGRAAVVGAGAAVVCVDLGEGPGVLELVVQVVEQDRPLVGDAGALPAGASSFERRK